MISSNKLKSMDFYRKIPRDLTEASISGAGLSIIAALSMMFLFGMELNNYLNVSTSTSVIVDKSSDADFLRIDFNLRLNITKTVHRFSIDGDLKPTGSEVHEGPVAHSFKHGDDTADESVEGSVALKEISFDNFAHQYPILVVNFYAPWCYWSNCLKPSWEKAAHIIRERYDLELDGRILLGKVDCTEEVDLCKRHHVQGYPSFRIFRKGSDLKDDHGHHDHESYYGDRDTDSLVKTMENLIAPILMKEKKRALENKADNATVDIKRPAPHTGDCRIEGYVRVKKVPGSLIISARAHSFDSSQMNMSHVISHLSFGMKINPKVLNDVKRLALILEEAMIG